LDLAIRTTDGGKYSVGLPPPMYEDLFRKLANVSEEGSMMTIGSSYSLDKSKRGATKMSMAKFSAKQADQILGRLDRIAATIQDKHEAWGMPFDMAKEVVNTLDRTADESDPDEAYMSNFGNPMEPIQTDADESYMSAYKDDQSSSVRGGKSTTGRPLTAHRR
jgi:hypothetical protein